ncbi:Cupredoxin superfamily protein [Striga hermonthica]|uniref:Cupredoxin superfamily protein n=1 Tax=Striga hermonthica TaxID=68872 RepID=A0A9N7NU57_STRHE|nr:Cupredoxin superfamily protein [Striga hermonthica]
MEVIKMMKEMMLLLMVVMIWMSNNNGAVVGVVNYTVGGDNGGWDQSTDLASWSSAQTFHPQDILIFEYTRNHNVLEVSAADFATCTTTNPLRPPQPPGTTRTVIPLTAAGSRYFICGTLGHCVSSMKLQVNTVVAAGQQPPSSTPTVPSPPPSNTPTVPSQPPPPPPPHWSTHSPAPKSSKIPSGTGNKAAAPSPRGSLAPPPAPSSATRLNVMGGVAAACVGFLITLI